MADGEKVIPGEFDRKRAPYGMTEDQLDKATHHTKEDPHGAEGGDRGQQQQHQQQKGQGGNKEHGEGQKQGGSGCGKPGCTCENCTCGPSCKC